MKTNVPSRKKEIGEQSQRAKEGGNTEGALESCPFFFVEENPRHASEK